MSIQVIPRRGRQDEAEGMGQGAWRDGRAAAPDRYARARGWTIRERENSIFSDAWIPIGIFFILLGLLTGSNTGLLTLGVGLLLIVGVSKWWKNHALDRVIYQRHFDRTHVFPGEPVTMTLTLRNDKWLPLTWLQLRDELPVSPDEEDTFSRVVTEAAGRYILQHTFALHSFQRIQRTATLRFPRRGYQHIGPVRVQSGDIFTLFTIERTEPETAALVVYPQVWALEELGLPAKEPFGELSVRHTLFTDPIRTRGIRDYHSGDRFRDVHWKATARRGKLQTKVYDPSTGMTLAIFLNVATLSRHWLGHFPDVLERAVSVAASLADHAARHKWGFGLYANGAVPRSDQPIRVPPGRSPDQLMHVLEALAAVTEFATNAIDVLLQRESPRLPWVATIVVVTAVVTDELAVTLLRLKEAGRRVVLISLAGEPPPAALDTIVTYHLPAVRPETRD